MRCHIKGLLAAVVTLLVCAFSTGSPVFLMLALLLLLMIGLGLAAVLWASRTLQVEAQLQTVRVTRGDTVPLVINVRHRSLIPIAPIVLELEATPDMPQTVLQLQYAPRMQQQTVMTMHASHVGASRPGVEKCVVEDLFGMFTCTWTPEMVGDELLVMPQTFEVEELTFAPGDAGLGTMARATEDITSPSDVRAYAPGDAMKKIHWKLSLRKRELLVRRFEEPVLPDALVLLDCSKRNGDADLRDALLETAASVMKKQQLRDHGVRLPLLGEHPVQLEKNMGMPLILENLARADFSVMERFEQVVAMESRHLSRIGAVVVITARLSGDLVEAISRMRRMGPVVRMYLITAQPDDEALLPFISRLQHATVEVCYVTPQAV